MESHCRGLDLEPSDDLPHCRSLRMKIILAGSIPLLLAVCFCIPLVLASTARLEALTAQGGASLDAEGAWLQDMSQHNQEHWQEPVEQAKARAEFQLLESSPASPQQNNRMPTPRVSTTMTASAPKTCADNSSCLTSTEKHWEHAKSCDYGTRHVHCIRETFLQCCPKTCGICPTTYSPFESKFSFLLVGFLTALVLMVLVFHSSKRPDSHRIR